MIFRTDVADCPWCGPMRGHWGFTLGRFGTRLTCFCCDSHGPIAPTQDAAVEAWNKRFAPAVPKVSLCTACGGTRRRFPFAPVASLAEVEPCPACNGTGVAA